MAPQKPLTIKQLKEICEKEIKKGNGDKSIMISNDDEVAKKEKRKLLDQITNYCAEKGYYRRNTYTYYE